MDHVIGRTLSANAAHGRVALATTPDYLSNDDQTSLVDLLADLMHAAGETGLNFETALATARTHYQEERHTPTLQAA